MAPAHLSSKSLTSTVSDPEANPVAVANAMDEATTKEWRDWLPETIRDFTALGGDDVQQLDKLMAVQVALTNPDVFESWPLFNSVCVAFNHRRVNFGWLDQPTIPELAWACTVLGKLQPSGVYDQNVLRYLAVAMADGGLTFFPWTGGDGYLLCDANETWSHGLMDAKIVCALGSQAKKIWNAGELANLEPSEVDPTNPLHAQLSALVRAQTYIRAQKPVNKDKA